MKGAEGDSGATARLFDRLPGETSAAWRAFCVYRDQGTARTLDGARKELKRKDAYLRTLERWRGQYAWEARAAAWDAAEKERLEELADPTDAATGLTLKQKRFADAYLANGGNGTRAAMTAGYSGDYNTLGVTAHDNLKKPKIRRYVDQRMREAAMSADEVLHGLSQIARGDIRDFIGRSGMELKAHPNGYLIKKLEMRVEVVKDEDGEETARRVEVTKLELYNRADALVQLGRYHKLFTDRMEIVDWREEAIPLVQRGGITFEQAVKEVGIDLATQLFESAGVAIAPS